jgi:hypothetical protein
MTLYHSINIIFETPSLDFSCKVCDFGAGFYTTTSREKAMQFAQIIMRRCQSNTQWVSIYDFDEVSAEKDLNILRFPGADKNWLDFVIANRFDRYDGKKYDIIHGPVANDDVYPKILLYESRDRALDEALTQLKSRKHSIPKGSNMTKDRFVTMLWLLILQIKRNCGSTLWIFSGS